MLWSVLISIENIMYGCLVALLSYFFFLVEIISCFGIVVICSIFSRGFIYVFSLGYDFLIERSSIAICIFLFVFPVLMILLLCY